MHNGCEDKNQEKCTPGGTLVESLATSTSANDIMSKLGKKDYQYPYYVNDSYGNFVLFTDNTPYNSTQELRQSYLC